MILTIRAKLIAIQEGQYTVYVFDNLDEQFSSKQKYMMCTRLPNWNNANTINKGDIGFLQYEFVESGSTYYKVKDEITDVYKHTGFYFLNFIEQSEKIENKDFNM